MTLKEEKRDFLRGDIYYADLNPIKGSEQGGVRPILILQNNIGNRYSPTVIVATVTTRPKLRLPTHIYIGNHPKPSYAQLEQIKTIDKTRLDNYLGAVTAEQMKHIETALKISVGLLEEDEDGK